MRRIAANCRPALIVAAGCALLLAALLAADLRAQGRTLFREDFESGSLEDSWLPYHEFGDSATSGFERNPEHVHRGKTSFRLTAVDRQGQESGSNLLHFFLPGEDRCYFRWYAKFDRDFDQGNLMHWVLIGGNRVDNQWSIFGRQGGWAGFRPDGQDFFVTILDPWRNWGRNPAPGELQFYSYFPEMTRDRDGHYWGNTFRPEKPCLVELGSWHCYEVMVKLNTPGEHDGEQAFWVDGKEIHRAAGMRWRDTADLKLNLLMPCVYIHQARKDNTCWFDDIEISTGYIGPIQ